MAGLLGDVLPWAFSQGDRAKRYLGGLLADPVGSMQQTAGLLQDYRREDQQLNARAFADQSQPFRVTDKRAMTQLADRAMAGPMGFAPAGITAWHGTPHTFDRFDSSKIGTGEGAQMYGRGLYFAEKPEVADSYRRRLSKDGGGNVYKVDIPDDAVSRMANLDKPLSQQPENVKGAFRGMGFDVETTKFKSPEEWSAAAKQFLTSKRAAQMAREDLYAAKDIGEARRAFSAGPDSLMAYLESPDGTWLRGGLTGAKGGDRLARSAYRDLAAQRGSPAEATNALMGAGVPGARFYDQGNGNFVLFDDSLATILNK